MSKESIIKVGRFDKASDYPIGQKLIINGRTCVVTKHGGCADCFFRRAENTTSGHRCYL